jgi:uncharacterized protein (DUF427 family)/RimJ/RimL family protein N-acetyltransferase
VDVRLEPMGDPHLAHIEDLVRDPSVLHFTRVPEPVPDGFAQNWIRRYEAARPQGTADGFAAFDGDTFVGLGLVPEIDDASRQAELGYIVASGARRRGAGTAILRALTEWAFAERGMLRLELIIETENLGSQSVARRAGYRLEGVKRSLHVKQERRADCEVWSRLAGDGGFAGPPRQAEPTPRRIRVLAGDEWVADSRRALLVIQYPPAGLPTYAIPEADATGGEPILPGHVTFPWDGSVQWYEEATPVFVHARDPHKRVDVLRSDRHVRIALDGVTLAESDRPVALFESPLPVPRWYLPPQDVCTELLQPSDTVTFCPYKGRAEYRSYGDEADLCWHYAFPLPECGIVRDHIAFFDERVDVWLDGELQDRPLTPWSPRR